MTEKDLRVSKIRNGTVIDHISAGYALDVIKILGITGRERRIITIAIKRDTNPMIAIFLEFSLSLAAGIAEPIAIPAPAPHHGGHLNPFSFSSAVWPFHCWSVYAKFTESCLNSISRKPS